MTPVNRETTMTDNPDGKRAWWRGRRISLWITCALFSSSLVWCLATVNDPGRLLFMPLGDVAGGFRSWDGRLEWIEYAGWERNPDKPQWSVPWWPVIAAEAVAMIYAARRRHI